jgi:hypothetical protein
MSSAFEQELAQSPLKVERRLPGLPVKDNKGNVPYYTATILNQSDRIQWGETNHPDPGNRLVFFAGDTFMWWCPRCRITVWEQECQMRFSKSCPFCRGHILALSPGDRVRIHYRYDPQGRWANWWGWRVER